MEHYRIVLEDEDTVGLFYGAGRMLARGDVPEEVVKGLRVGRMVALQKDDGRVRGLVMSDVIRRLVARTVAQQLAKPFQAACSPF